MKKFQVAIQWGGGHRYFVTKDGFDLEATAKFRADQENERAQKLHKKTGRGAKPTVYVLKVLKKVS